MGVEFELKFAAAPEQQEKLLAQYGPWQSIQMETTYFDTPKRCLSQHHITLRRRMENGISVCTVKTPLPGNARGEWECQCSDIHRALILLQQSGIPEEIAQLASEGLHSYCGARFLRQACPVTLAGAVAELALDRGVLLGADREIPFCEIEVELKSGDAETVTAFAASLAQELGLQPENRSKFHRAMLLAEGESV